MESTPQNISLENMLMAPGPASPGVLLGALSVSLSLSLSFFLFPSLSFFPSLSLSVSLSQQNRGLGKSQRLGVKEIPNLYISV